MSEKRWLRGRWVEDCYACPQYIPINPDKLHELQPDTCKLNHAFATCSLPTESDVVVVETWVGRGIESNLITKDNWTWLPQMKIPVSFAGQKVRVTVERIV